MRFLAGAAAAVAFVAPPAPGPKGLENVPIPQVPSLAPPKALKLNQTIDGIKCELAEKVVFHIHSHLAIFVNGKQKQVPYGIGIGPPLRGENFAAGPFAPGWLLRVAPHPHGRRDQEEGPTKQTPQPVLRHLGIKLSDGGPAHVTTPNGKVGRATRTRSLTAMPDSLDVGSPLVAEQKVGFGQLG